MLKNNALRQYAVISLISQKKRKKLFFFFQSHLLAFCFRYFFFLNDQLVKEVILRKAVAAIKSIIGLQTKKKNNRLCIINHNYNYITRFSVSYIVQIRMICKISFIFLLRKNAYLKICPKLLSEICFQTTPYVKIINLGYKHYHYIYITILGSQFSEPLDFPKC